MSWSWKLGRIFGIPVYVHWTFLILIAWVAYASWEQTHTQEGVAAGVGFILALFGCVVLHESGHALMARRFGVSTSDITLLPIGGVARLQRIPERPIQEFLVALAGPAVNVAIAVVLFLGGVRLVGPIQVPRHFGGGEFLASLLGVNVFLVGFNMLPAFPMDGGRVLRALLALRMPYARATRLAASIGQMMAILFGLLGLTSGNPFLLLIALFVWIGAESEAALVEEKVLLKDRPVRLAMITEFHTLAPSDTLGHAVDLLLAGTQHDFPVMRGDQAAGLLTRSDLMAGLATGGRNAPVADHVKTAVGTVEAETPLADASARMRQGEGPCLQVVESGRTVGLLTLENIGEYLMVQSALALEPARR